MRFLPTRSVMLRAERGSMDALVRCSICWQDCKADDAKHLALYCNGSEGITVCLDCRMALAEAARGMMRLASKCRMAGHRAAKEIAAAKAGTSNKEVSVER